MRTKWFFLHLKIGDIQVKNCLGRVTLHKPKIYGKGVKVKLFIDLTDDSRHKDCAAVKLG